jgi:hypothetical protein
MWKKIKGTRNTTGLRVSFRRFRAAQHVRHLHDLRTFTTFTLLLVALMFCANLMAEVPPLSEATLKSSPYIITGTVKSITKRDVAIDECFVRVDVTVAVKRDPLNTAGAQGKSTQHDRVLGHLMTYKCTDRPRPPGPGGIWGLESLRKGDKVTIYAVKSSSDGTLLIRQPNGLLIGK